jgi:hypothetical protein
MLGYLGRYFKQEKRASMRSSCTSCNRIFETLQIKNRAVYMNLYFTSSGGHRLRNNAGYLIF